MLLLLVDSIAVSVCVIWDKQVFLVLVLCVVVKYYDVEMKIEKKSQALFALVKIRARLSQKDDA